MHTFAQPEETVQMTQRTFIQDDTQREENEKVGLLSSFATGGARPKVRFAPAGETMQMTQLTIMQDDTQGGKKTKTKTKGDASMGGKGGNDPDSENAGLLSLLSTGRARPNMSRSGNTGQTQRADRREKSK
jgi:hypothetical protein